MFGMHRKKAKYKNVQKKNNMLRFSDIFVLDDLFQTESA